jgi:hypothetical protein
MAKGNMGNLLQHYVALHAARALDAQAGAFEYVDLFAMAPWEGLERATAGFKRAIATLDARPADDLVAATFRAAWARRYGKELLPPAPKRQYPNTAALLLEAPVRLAKMAVCEHEETRRAELLAYLDEHAQETPHDVFGRWEEVRFANRANALMIMVDAYQVHRKTQATSKKPGYITVDRIRGALGALGLLKRGDDAAATPAVATIFSYGELEPDATHRVLEAELEGKWGWNVTRVQEPDVSPRAAGKTAWHQGWWCASHESVRAPDDLQQRWEQWRG